MSEIRLIADASERLDKFISEKEDITRSFVKKLADEGKITASGKVRDASYKIKIGEEIAFELPEPEEIDAKPENIPLDIVYEDDTVIVINKPRGMVVHPAPGSETGTLVNAVLYHAKGSLSGINGALRPGIVHRIDKDTTGLLVVAKTNEAHLKLAAQLSDHTLGREYLALVHGTVGEDGTVDAPIGRSEKDRKKMAVTNKASREAVTNYFVEERLKGYTLLRCRLKTGRTHQIRVHMKYIGHPIAGDKTYGARKEEFNLAGQLLHAGKISFVHPVTGETVSFTAPLPEDFSKVLDILKKR